MALPLARRNLRGFSAFSAFSANDFRVPSAPD
jgi:hypothetical protein